MLGGRVLVRSHSDGIGIAVVFLCHLFSMSVYFCYCGGGDGFHNQILAILINKLFGSVKKIKPDSSSGK